jgi:plasmid stabilization system protein ParE
MIYKLVLTPRAKMDRDRAFDWYCTNYSKEFAARWYDGISRTLKSLTVDPMLCHKAHENDRFPFEVYEILHG